MCCRWMFNGAGISVAGLTCASTLADNGFKVCVFDAGRGSGGRMAQRRESTAEGQTLCFDHGAQYFTVEDPVVLQLVEKWKMAGTVKEWLGHFGALDITSRTFMEETDSGKKRYVGVPGMNAICKALSSKLGVESKFGTTVTKVEWREEEGYWQLKSKNGQIAGEFCALVIADKSLASARFTGQTGLAPPLGDAEVPSLSSRVATVSVVPCFAAMLAFHESLTTIPLDGLTILNSKVLAWAARDSSKPDRKISLGGNCECWVLHSTVEYAETVISRAGLVKPSEELLASIALDLLEEFQNVIPGLPDPCFIKAHRWGGAFPTKFVAPEEKCILVEEKRIVACGDYCLGPRVECAILSGLAAANNLLQVLKTVAWM
ncbi:hypothetical protein O6H91_12G080200 [Diphasiastrum complanatum]|uniref:Uncharacterized protein n=1 Tax=Diphasiastrum complanatum TaxID=34168 RepID=A0ACC2C424_DIPCM|nr:hypothetical protein O6H91_12G080200 [Diphasiastrum complanatum]